MTEAVRYLFHRSDDPVKCIHLFLANEDVRVRGAALLCLARETRNNRRLREVFDPGQLVEKPCWVPGNWRTRAGPCF